MKISPPLRSTQGRFFEQKGYSVFFEIKLFSLCPGNRCMYASGFRVGRKRVGKSLVLLNPPMSCWHTTKVRDSTPISKGLFIKFSGKKRLKIFWHFLMCSKGFFTLGESYTTRDSGLWEEEEEEGGLEALIFHVNTMCMESCVGRERKGKRGGGVFWEKYWKVACMIKLSLFRQERNFENPFGMWRNIYPLLHFSTHTHPAPSPAKRKASEKFQQQKVKKNFFCPHHQPHIRALQLHTKSQSAAGRWVVVVEKKSFCSGVSNSDFFACFVYTGKGRTRRRGKIKFRRLSISSFLEELGGTQERGKEELIKIFLGLRESSGGNIFAYPKKRRGLALGRESLLKCKSWCRPRWNIFFRPLALPPLPHIYRGGI